MHAFFRTIVCAAALAVACAPAAAAAVEPRYAAYRLATDDADPWGIAATRTELWVASQRNPGILTRTTPGALRRAFGFAPPFEFTGGVNLVEKDKKPTAVAADDAGNVWYTKIAGDGIVGRIAPGDAQPREWDLDFAGSQPTGIAPAADGGVWFTLRGKDRLGRIDAAGVEHYYSVGVQEPEDVAVGPDGNVWFTVRKDPGAIGRMTPSGQVTTFTTGLTPNSYPKEIVAGPDGAMWFTEYDGARVGRITMAGTITEYALPSGSQPTGIAVAGDGNLWVAGAGNGGWAIRVTPSGGVTPYALSGLLLGSSTNPAPSYVTRGPDGNVWFTEAANPGGVARVTVGPALASPTAKAVTHSSAVLEATLRPNGEATTYWAEYMPSTSGGSATVRLNAGAGAGPLTVQIPLDDLQPDSTYRFRVVAENATGQVVTAAETFHTDAAPAPAPTPDPQPQPTPEPQPSPEPSPAPPPVAEPQPTPEPHIDPAPAPQPPPTLLTAPPSAPITSAPALGGASVAPTPVLGETVALKAQGTVLVRLPGAAAPVPLDGAGTIPVGAVVDALRGTVRITSAVNGRGATQTGSFWGGAFEVRQPRGERGMVELALRGRISGCAKRLVARSSAKRQTRKLWGKDHGGRFRTRGSNSIATVRGTRWLVEDRCDGTLTRVTEGRVAVRDLVRRRTVVVRAGGRYVAAPEPTGRRG